MIIQNEKSKEQIIFFYNAEGLKIEHQVYKN